LAYGEQLVERIMNDPLIGEEAAQKFKYYPTTTQEASLTHGRITNLMREGKLFKDLGVPNLGADDRIMICGSMPLNLEIKELCEAAGLKEGSNSMPGEFVLEKAFVG
ncbi:MAG: ferredoxin--NADP reductase, partial [Nitratireductor sp.]